MGEEEQEEEGEEPSSPSRYGDDRRHFIVLAGLGGILGVTIVVIVISIVLRPAHVEFTVVHTTMNCSSSSSSSNSTSSESTISLNLTVQLQATAASAKVSYRSVFVDLIMAADGNDDVPPTRNESSSGALTLHAPVDPGDLKEQRRTPQPAGTPASFRATSLVVQADDDDDEVDVRGGRLLLDGDECRDGSAAVRATVVVTALVSFVVGPVFTRSYHVVVHCPYVQFHMNGTINPAVNCTA
ncbi:uncharacterized protein LOC121054664 [Oryza brachyantha]|uniref:Late embryogenesis abundant protein LEA-2 subgroup domain-containing protein n=1 Tax=Oryza brachyantha TaxID=4533 RepID=J3MAT4_ORYBR|nr:uncharacterized protein LOC121054664 [Oryza brachyantha]